MIMNQKILHVLNEEKQRQQKNLQFIASENFASESVMRLTGSIFTNKYAEGYPGKRYYNGCENMDDIEILANEFVQDLFNAGFSNVQPHSGANANFAVMQALLKPGDKVVAMSLDGGGHLSHGAPVNWSSKTYEFHHYGVNEDGFIDYDYVRDLVNKVKPKMVIAGASAYPRKINWKEFREIANEVDAYFMVDMAHYSGLVAGKAYPNPAPYADVVTSTTHKTLRGPRGGIILWNNKGLTKKINSAVFPGTQGGPLMNVVAAKAQSFYEASLPEFKEYSQNVITNAQNMSREFMSQGIDVLTGGTDSHMIVLDLSKLNVTGKQVANELEEQGITVNKNSIPNDQRNFIDTSGIRIGTAAETTRGHNTEWFKRIANDIANIIHELN